MLSHHLYSDLCVLACPNAADPPSALECFKSVVVEGNNSDGWEKVRADDTYYDDVNYYTDTDACNNLGEASTGDDLDKGKYELIFQENFDSITPSFDPNNSSCNYASGAGPCPDRSSSFDARVGSARFPFGDWKNNTAGNDAHWNVNFIGLDSGLGWTANNIYPDMEQFAEILLGENPDYAARPVFENTDGKLKITAYTNPWENRINGRKEYLAGVWSTHANPGNATAHGWEGRGGIYEICAKLNDEGGGTRFAFWNYSDNAYFNKLFCRLARHEIDTLEWLPNTRVGDNFALQSDVFGTSSNTSILTYDTVFNTYHQGGDTAFPNRTSENCTLNFETPYNRRREALTLSSNSPIDLQASHVTEKSGCRRRRSEQRQKGLRANLQRAAICREQQLSKKQTRPEYHEKSLAIPERNRLRHPAPVTCPAL